MKVGRTFYFDAAHYLPDYQGKCEKLHGHTYRLDVEVSGEVGSDGLLIDFTELKKIVSEEVLEKLDHQELNKLMSNPTAENIVEWIWAKLEDGLNVHRIRLWEGQGKWVEKTRG
jgi:6-pyruvoyltetrahydropterin/6-carboxytetrahydropterin synthase